MENDIKNYTNKDVIELLVEEKVSSVVIEICKFHDIDGQCLLCLEDRDFYEHPFDKLKLGDKKRFILFVKKIQKCNRNAMCELGLCDESEVHPSANINFLGTNLSNLGYNIHNSANHDFGYTSPDISFSTDVRASKLKSEIWKTAISLGVY